MTIAAAYILWQEIRWAAIIGMAIVFLIVPIQSWYLINLQKLFFFFRYLLMF